MIRRDYIREQFERIATPNLRHVAGVLQIKGDCGGKTNWINISTDDLKAIQAILERSTGTNS
jgi:hypothetical protein